MKSIPESCVRLLLLFAIMPAAVQAAVPPNPRAQAVAEGVRTALAELHGKQMHPRPAAASLPAPMTASPLLRKRGKAPEILLRANGTPMRIQGGVLEPADARGFRSEEARNQATARNFLRINRALLKIRNPDREFALAKRAKDQFSGGSRLRFEQKYQGLPVWPGEIGVYLDAQGNVKLMNGAYVPTPRRPLHVKPAVSADKARDKAMAGRADSARATEPELIIYAPGDTPPRLAWRLEVQIAINVRLVVAVDALTGEILTEFNRIHGAAAVGSGMDLSGQTRSLNLFEESGQYFLIDTSKPMYNLQQGPSMEQGSIIISDWQNQPEDAKFDPVLTASVNPNGGFLADAVSAAYNLSEVYDYYFERHGRNSLDGQGASLLGVVRVGSGMSNAFWNGQAMFFGDALMFAAALDMAGHELSHGVIETSAGLVYQGESGALNEAFADIFGEMAERRTKGRADWLTGPDTGEIVRSFIDPRAYQQPATMSEFVHLPNTREDDNGGVHINSGIINHAYYLLAEGLAGAVGADAAEKIFYRALTQYLVRNSRFADARLAVLDAATDLFGAGSLEYQAAAEAFDRTGITASLPATPPPASFPAVSDAEDAALFICMVQDGTRRICGYDPGLGDTEPVVLSLNEAAATRIAVDGSGIMAAFVTSNRDLCLLPVDGSKTEVCLGMPGSVWSVAMSPDARYFAFVLMNAQGNIEPAITVSDIVTEIDLTYQLVAPAIDGGRPANTILGADSLVFTADSSTVVYDALNVFRTADGREARNWAIYSLDLQTGITYNLIDPGAGEDVGFPVLSKTSDNFMAFDMFNEQTGQIQVYTIDLNSGDYSLIDEFQGQQSIPDYTGDDRAIVYMYPNSGASLGYNLAQRPLANDRRTPQGNTMFWLENAVCGAVYRRGAFIGPQPSSAFFDLRTGIMRIYAVQVPNAFGGVDAYQADLLAAGDSLLLAGLSPALAGWMPETSAVYRPDNTMLIPRAELTDSTGNTSFWTIVLSLTGLDPVAFVIPEGGLMPAL
ncbi:MAG: hypothetical protein GY862_01765 [Gammaproteobacteria bacterium]|nr:hypothetical protein [Gammaproteobacteria bacterium]